MDNLKNKNFMLINDQPIKNSNEDLLERNSFSKDLANAICNYTNQDSLVISINGEWGSGKSSVINLMVEELKNLNYKKDKVPQIINFNPWNFSDQNQLYEQFFKKISSEIGRKNNSAKIKKIGNAITKYSKILNAGKFIPIVNTYSEIVKDSASSAGEFLKNIGKDLEEDLETTKGEINKLLLDVDKKFILIIDDIDRLNKTEIKQIFQMVKSLGDFKNTVYILSFDRNVVARALDEVQTGSGINYLEKIIQVPFEIPNAPTYLIHKYFLTEMTKTIKDLPDERFDSTYWASVFNYGIKFMIKNIRDVKRFCNVFGFKYNIIKNEVNIIDLISLTCIEIFEPELFLDIKNNKDLFTGTFEKSTFAVRTEWAKGDNLEKIKQLEEIINKVKRTKKIHIKKLLEKMFPKFDENYRGRNSLREWRKEGRIASPNNFDSFFALSFTEEKISNHTMSKIIESTKDSIKFGKNIEKIINKGLTNDFLDKFFDYSSLLNEKSTAQNVINVLMDSGDLFPEIDITLRFETPTDAFIRILINSIIENFDKEEDRFILYKNSIMYTKNSLYTPCYQIWLEDFRHGKYSTEKETYQEEKAHVSLQQVGVLEKLCVNKIHEWKDKKSLLNHPNLGFIMYVWKLWENEEVVENFVNENTKTELQLAFFVEKFLLNNTYYSGSIKIDEFLDKLETEKRVRKILDKKIRVTPSQQTALEKYIDNLKPKNR